MSISYNWTISETNYQVANGYVFCAHWQATAVDGEHTASIYSTCSWADGTVNTPYDQLTQETVLGWVWANGVDKTATEAALAAQIEAQKNPVTATGTPWSQA
jgi:hypothetical protein